MTYISSSIFLYKYSNNFFIPAETDPHEGKRKVEALWPIFKIHHQRSRYIFDLYYKRKAVSRGSVKKHTFEN